MNHNDRDLFARDGHLTMLSVDRYDVGELAGAARHVVESHAEGCSSCRARLLAVQRAAAALRPPPTAGRSAGSVSIGVLVASAGIAAAASFVLGVLSVPWPDPQTAHPMPGEPLHVSGAYTSVAQDAGEPDAPALHVSLRSEDLVVSGIEGAHLAVFAVSTAEDVGDTGGPAEPVVLGVLASMPTTGEDARVSIPAQFSGLDLVVVACPIAPDLAIGDALALDPGCTAADAVAPAHEVLPD